MTGKMSDSPMHEHSPACIESFLNELDTFGEVLQQILIVHVVDLYNLVGEAFEESVVQRQP